MAGTPRRRKASSAQTPTPTSAKRPKPTFDFTAGDNDDDDDDDEINSDHDDDFFRRDNKEDSSSDEEEKETAEQKKVRLAREYLDKIEQQDSSDESSGGSGSGSDSEEEDKEDEDDGLMDPVSRKLQKQRLKREGVWERQIADKIASRIEGMTLEMADKNRLQREQQHPRKDKIAALNPREQAQEWISHKYVQLVKGHDLTPTCVKLQADGSKAVSGSKDHSVLLWDMETSTKIVTLWDHWKKHKDDKVGNRTDGQVLSLAVSDDGRYAAVGRKDACVQIFDLRSRSTNTVAKTFRGHKAGVTCLAFQTQSLSLFSGSEDRCIRYVIIRVYLLSCG